MGGIDLAFRYGGINFGLNSVWAAEVVEAEPLLQAESALVLVWLQDGADHLHRHAISRCPTVPLLWCGGYGSPSDIQLAELRRPRQVLRGLGLRSLYSVIISGFLPTRTGRCMEYPPYYRIYVRYVVNHD